MVFKITGSNIYATMRVWKQVPLRLLHWQSTLVSYMCFYCIIFFSVSMVFQMYASYNSKGNDWLTRWISFSNLPNLWFSFNVLIICSTFTECDIRSCLNTLQFLDKKKEILNVVGFYYDFAVKLIIY